MSQRLFAVRSSHGRKGQQMARYFMSGTPLASFEREMMTPPGFGCRRVREEKKEQKHPRISNGAKMKKGTIEKRV